MEECSLKATTLVSRLNHQYMQTQNEKHYSDDKLVSHYIEE